jgi:hypothetical protein
VAEWEEPRHSGHLVMPPYPTIPHCATPFPTFPSEAAACALHPGLDLALQSGLTADLRVGHVPVNEHFSLHERLQDMRAGRNRADPALLG